MPRYWVDRKARSVGSPGKIRANSDHPNNLRREDTVVVALEITSQPGLSDSFHSWKTHRPLKASLTCI